MLDAFDTSVMETTEEENLLPELSISVRQSLQEVIHRQGHVPPAPRVGPALRDSILSFTREGPCPQP